VCSNCTLIRYVALSADGKLLVAVDKDERGRQVTDSKFLHTYMHI